MQTHPITIYSGPRTHRYNIPCSWSVNKVKCLLVDEKSSPAFDNFSFMFQGRLLAGQENIGDLVSTKHGKFVMSVVACRSLQKFEEYYQRQVGRYVNSISLNKTLPIFWEAQDQQQQEEKQNDQIDEDEAIQKDFALIFHILAMLLLFAYVIKYCSRYQILFLLAVWVLHSLIENYGNPQPEQIKPKTKSKLHQLLDFRHSNSQKKSKIFANSYHQIEQAAEQHQKPTISISTRPRVGTSSQRPLSLKTRLVLYSYKTAQTLFCLILMMFPNWNASLHEQLTSQITKRWRAHMNTLHPNMYPSS